MLEAALGSRTRDRVRTWRADREFRRRVDADTSAGAAAELVDDAPQHVVVVVVDALRADAVDSSTTPHLASMLGTAAVSPSTWTFPAVASLLSGRYPHDHGAIRRVDDFEHSVADMTGLPPQPRSDCRLLPERLAEAGYRTRGVFSMIVPFLALSGRFGSHELYRDASADRVLSNHLEWLADRRDERTFSYVHLGDLHEPVDPPADYWDARDVDETIPDVRTWRFEDVADPSASPTVERYRTHRRRLYRAAAEYVDNRLSAFRTRADELLPETLVVVCGDHGEAFWEHAAFAADRFADPRPAYCVGHGGAPYEAVARVPLCVGGTSAAADRIREGDAALESASNRPDPDGRRSLIDVAPTVLEAVGLPAPSGVAGTSLAASVEDRRLLVESARYGYEKKAVYDGDRKLLVSAGDGVVAGFSLPEETPCTLADDREAALLEALPSWPGARSKPRADADAAAEPGDGPAPDGDSAGRPAEREVSRDVQRRLDRLGYR
ncbi:sulfatase-like hydrolase/transferase [Halopiger thermotolerans]